MLMTACKLGLILGCVVGDVKRQNHVRQLVLTDDSDTLNIGGKSIDINSKKSIEEQVYEKWGDSALDVLGTSVPES